MALNSSRSALSSYSRTLRQCRCTPAVYAPGHASTSPRSFSSSPAVRSERPEPPYPVDEIEDTRPRWSYTPRRMQGPGFSINIVKDPRRKIWSVNQDPNKLDAMYKRFLGPNGDRLLPDEVKWLAVTHKSFDQGRRGYNTKLAYFGRLILSLEATRSVVTSTISEQRDTPDRYGRQPFHHPALANVDKLSVRQPRDLLDKDKIARLATEIGLADVTRWKPRLPENLEGSGIVAVLNTTVFAIIGAISLQQGAEVASKVARERILKRLGA